MKLEKDKLVKLIIYWVLMAVVAVVYTLYLTLGWSDLVYNKADKLDAVLKSVAIILLANAISKLLYKIVIYVGAKSQKGLTVSKLLASIIKYAVGIIAIIMILSNFIADTSGLITGISMLTLVIGLGAQSLISDIVAGIFIVFEGDYKVGDVVVIDGWRGRVNEIGIRTTKIEDAGGNIQIINNSKISKIINNSSELSIAMISVGIEYGESIERVENVINSNLEKIKKNIPAIVEGPFYKGVEALGDSSVVIKIIAKCKEDDKFQTQRDMNREIKIIFDKNNVGIPFPQVTISHLVDSTSTVTKAEERKARAFMENQKDLSQGLEENQN